MSTLLPYHDSYKHTGEGQAKGDIVLLHGWGMNSLVWDDMVPLLNEHYQVSVIDLPGMGRSPLPSQDYDLDFLVEQVLTVAPPKAVWIAWSLGALVLQKIMLAYPERASLAFCISGTPCFVAQSDWPFAMPGKVFEKFQALLEEDWQGTLIRFLTLQCKGSESIKQDTQKLREYMLHYGFPAQRALREGLNILKQNDLRSELQQSAMTHELHFILGQFDTLIPIQVANSLEQLNTAIKVHAIEGASHVPHVSHPQMLSSLILAEMEMKEALSV